MGTAANDTFTLWCEEGKHLIPQNFKEFRSLVSQAKDYLERGDCATAAVYAQMAALHAMGKHCGLFVSPELEHILLKIGQRAIKSNCYRSKSSPLPGRPRRVLHVATCTLDIGGLSRMIWRWIKQDTSSSHSVVLTQQSPNKVPEALIEVVLNSNGKIHVLNEGISNLISCARRLRKIAVEADLIVLHISNEDVIPVIAFANKDQLPRILFLNHSDHMFWLGSGISDIVINLRESGMLLSRTRRNIEVERNVLLPIILEPTQRVLSRAEAKQQIGIPNNSILLLSIARSVKYRAIDGINFADVHVQLLEQHKQAILVVIGPGKSDEDWSLAIQKTQGRIRVLEETNDTAKFYQAADIYVDSFPFVSITSLLEAGSYGLPLLSRYPYSSDVCKILGADAPGLTDNLLLARDLTQYTEILTQLIRNEKFRQSLGDRTHRKIMSLHTGDYWERSLQQIYVQAINIPKVNMVLNQVNDKMYVGEPDVFLPRVYGWDVYLDGLIGQLPINQRLRHWFKLAKKYSWRRRITLLLPSWLNTFYVRLKISLKTYSNSKT